MATNQNDDGFNGDEFSGEEFTREEIEAAQATAYALGQLHGEERAEVERRLTGGEADHREMERLKAIADAVAIARSSESAPADGAMRNRIEQELIAHRSTKSGSAKVALAGRRKWRRWPSAVEWCVIGGICCLLAVLLLPPIQVAREAAWKVRSSDHTRSMAEVYDSVVIERGYLEHKEKGVPDYGGISGATNHTSDQLASELPFLETRQFDRRMQGDALGAASQTANDAEVEVAERKIAVSRAELEARGDINDALSLSQLRKDQFNFVEAQKQAASNVAEKALAGLIGGRQPATEAGQLVEVPTGQSLGVPAITYRQRGEGQVGEQYDPIIENVFLSPLEQPLSTFSIDVDTASYANMRRFLTSGRLPPRNSVRIEELVNYFRYEYSEPRDSEPFSVNMELAECPWAPGTLTPALSQRERGHLLLRVGIKGKVVQRNERPASNLVFLLDVSGSMSDENKLPLLKTAMKLLVNELGENDRVSIVTYAGDAGLKLKSTRGDQQQRIMRAIDSLQAGGSTNGSAGIELAYEQATANFLQGGANRVILCTDGDLNVGITSDEALTKLIKQKAKSGVFLTVLGFGEGNLKDAKMEKLADNGNGLYAYIDSVREARKVLVEQLTGSTITIAKDVKIQIEFNPAQIATYRLLGYENRVMAAKDFNNDKKDAGEIGAGHTVTALYELVPVGGADEMSPRQPGTDPLKYQQPRADLRPENRGSSVDRGAPGPSLVPAKGETSGELLTLKLRYKEPEGETSKLLEYPLKDRGHSFHSASPDFQFAAAVAGFGMILRNSQHRGSATLDGVAEIASGALGKDEGGYRAEFVDLVRKAQALGAR